MSYDKMTIQNLNKLRELPQAKELVATIKDKRPFNKISTENNVTKEDNVNNALDNKMQKTDGFKIKLEK